MNVFSRSYAVLTSVPDWHTILASWIKILYVCAGLLLVETLLILLLAWMRHLSWRVRLTALVPLAAGVGTVVAARFIDGMYFGGWFVLRSPIPSAQAQIIAGLENSIHRASVLGWLGIGLTSILLVLGLIGARRLPARPRRLSVAES